MQNKANLKTSTIEYQESCIENMQNEPNFTHTAHMPTSPHGSRAPGHESRIMQNEPNFSTFMYLKVPKIHYRNSQISALIYAHKANFYSKIAKKPRILQISDINTLNSIYNKDLHGFLTRKTLQTSRDPSKEFYTPKAEKMQNEPNSTSKRRIMQNEANFNQPATSTEIRDTKKCKTNPIYNRSNISACAIVFYINSKLKIINNKLKVLSHLDPIFYNS